MEDQGFVIAFDRIRVARLCGLSIHRCRFAPELYGSRLFGAFGIALPAQIAASAPKRQREFLAGRLCAREAARAVGLRPGEIGIGADRSPCWPAGVVGSISHCSSQAIAVCARSPLAASIGIDVEPVLDDGRADALGRSIMTRAETDRLAGGIGIGSGGVGFAVTLGFSVKESVYKALFPLERIRFGFAALEMTGLDPRTGEAFVRTRQAIGRIAPRTTFAVGYAVREGVVVTGLCTPTPGAPGLRP